MLAKRLRHWMGRVSVIGGVVLIAALCAALAAPETARDEALRAVSDWDVARAVTLLERAVEAEIRPRERANLQLLLALFYDLNGQPDDAITTIHAVMDFDPELTASFPQQRIHNLSVPTRMGDTLRHQGDLNGAIYWWEQALLRRPGSDLPLGQALHARRSLGARGELTAPPMVMARGLIPSRLTADQQRLLVPAAKLAEALQLQSTAGDELETITLSREGGATLTLTADSRVAAVDGAEAEMEVAPQVIEEELWVPLRFVVEAFGHTIEWEAPARIAWVR